jgi:hypothetical protein
VNANYTKPILAPSPTGASSLLGEGNVTTLLTALRVPLFSRAYGLCQSVGPSTRLAEFRGGSGRHLFPSDSLAAGFRVKLAVNVNDHFCYILEAVKYPRQDRLSDGRELLRHSGVESDRKFWSGERPLSLAQWIGIILMLMTVGVVIAMSAWFEGNYVAVIVILGGLALFVVLGNLRAHRSPNK